MSEHEQNESRTILDALVGEMLLDRTEGLPPSGLAAFIDGWSSLLELVGRSDLLIPDAPPAIHDAVSQLCSQIKAAQARALEDDF